MSDAPRPSTTHDADGAVVPGEAQTLAPAPREIIFADSATLPPARPTAAAAPA
jgi:hypothetical protein